LSAATKTVSCGRFTAGGLVLKAVSGIFCHWGALHGSMG